VSSSLEKKIIHEIEAEKNRKKIINKKEERKHNERKKEGGNKMPTRCNRGFY